MTKRKRTHQVCTHCNKRQALVTEYYSTKNVLFPEGRIPICKSCSLKIIELHGFYGFKMLMQLIDKPILRTAFKKDEYQKYITSIQSLPQFKDLTYDDSTMLDPDILQDGSELKVYTPEELKQKQEFWGKGFTEEDYHFLENEWAEIVATQDVIGNKNMEIYVREICLTQLQMRKDRGAGKNIRQLVQNLNDLMTAANLKPLQESGANGMEQETFGTIVAKIENERPIPEPAEEWADVDGIRKEIRVWFTGMLQKSLGLENQFQEEFDAEVKKYTVEPDRGFLDE